ncbi:MAG: hypothetical protein K9M57_03680 [Phycisphaerae bacterium]|nr:hypothetical protein [Phycisphaerae bacterium]
MLKTLTSILLLTIYANAPIAQASPVIDGMFDLSEGYTNSYAVSYNGISNDLSGRVLTHQNGQILSVAVIQSLGLVDNAYSPKIGGKGNGIGTSGWGHKTHTLKDLANSDRARFQILGSDHATPVIDFTVDYFASVKDKKSITGYGDFGVNGKDGTITTGAVISTATSMGYNYSRFGSNETYFPLGGDEKTMDQTASSPIAKFVADENNGSVAYRYENSVEPDWVFESIYEFQVDLNNTPFTIDNLVIKDIHNSPFKVDINGGLSSCGYQETPLNTVPEPATFSLAILGFGLMRWTRKRMTLRQTR